jgi:predicted phosphodiesterase
MQVPVSETDTANAARGSEPENLLILSDLHLGNPASYLDGLEEIRDLIEEIQPDRVIFNGDTVEMRHEPDMVRGARLAREAREMCARAGAEAVFITGNHDPAISENHYLEMAGGKVLATHGDILFPTIVPWSREASIAWEMHQEKLGEVAGDRPLDELSLTERFHALRVACLDYESIKVSGESTAFGKVRMILNECWPPTRPLLVLQVWMRTPGLAREFAAKHFPRAKWILLGHTHRAGIWIKKGVSVINTGSFTPLSGRQIIILRGNTLQVRPVRCRENKSGERKRWFCGDPVFEKSLG